MLKTLPELAANVVFGEKLLCCSLSRLRSFFSVPRCYRKGAPQVLERNTRPKNYEKTSGVPMQRAQKISKENL
jgi:hypothetical protein